jgi:hypothetical protein
VIIVDQLPAKGVPKIPTASSAQIRKKASRIAAQIRNRRPRFFTLLKTSSQPRPVVNNKTPMIIKSDNDQSTSLVNCIAINGMDNRIATVKKIAISLLYFIGID